MIQSFFRKFAQIASHRGPQRTTPTIAPSVPSDCRVYAIGDVHGQLRQLKSAVERIRGDARRNTTVGSRTIVIFLGDYVDRGEESAAVLDFLSTPLGEEAEWIFLSGNHEAAMLAFLDDPVRNAAWLGFGGIETLASYGILAPAAPASARSLRACRDLLNEGLPPTHLAFLRSLRDRFVCGDYIFVHAGLRPGIPLDRQNTEDLLWIREDFINKPMWHGKCVVHGHTIVKEAEIEPWRIGIDTGAYAGGPLTCLVLEGQSQQTLSFR
jgi:serine/threonine protein phosphatase 1